MFSKYDLFIATVSATIGFIYVPDNRIFGATMLFILALISQWRNWYD